MTIITACAMDCTDGCSLAVDPEKRTVRGNTEHPFTKGFCCPKGARYFERLDAEDRITTPLIKENGGFREASWDEALGLVAGRIDAARTRPETMLYVHGYGYRGVLSKAGVALFKALGASATSGSVCVGTGMAASVADFGALDQNAPEDILNASRIVNWGRDLTRCSVHQLRLVRQARERGAEVLTISPGGDGTPEFSDVNVTIRPGADRFLAAAVIKLLLEAGDLRPEVLARCANWPALRGLVDGCRFAELLRVCEVPAADAEMVYEWYAASGRSATLVGGGLQRHLYGGENVRFINALAMLSGNVGVAGGGVSFSGSFERHLGSWEHLMVPEPPAQRKLLIQDLAAELRRADPPVDFVWIDGVNVVNQMPDSRAIAEALREPFVVCVDGFFNDTALAADVILPPAFMLEDEDVIGSSSHHCVNLGTRAVAPRGECRPIFDIFTNLGSRLAEPVLLPEADTCLREALGQKGVSLDALREKGFVEVAHPAVAFEGMRFAHADGLYRLPEHLNLEPGRGPDYPLQLLTVANARFLNSQVPEHEQQGVPTVFISGGSPACGCLDASGEVRLATPLGSLPVRVERDDTVHPHTVLMHRGGWLKTGHGANAIIEPMVTDMGRGAAYLSQCCRLEFS